MRGLFVCDITMPRSIAIMITASAHGAASSQTALAFARAVIERGDSLQCLFFYHEAASLGSALAITPQDEINLPQSWQAFIADNQLEAIVCIASGLKRGIINAQEQARYEKTAFNLSPAMALEGLGQWVEAVRLADQHIVFGN